MGQTSSKRRSYTPGKDENTEIATTARTNGNVKANGSIEVHGDHDVSGLEPTSPTSPTSVTSASSSASTGKKDKRKRFRVIGFSLKRTPSGRWTRKRRATAQNGTRPMSCPNPVPEEPEQAASSSRPQSLFLDELDIQEDDSKIETVDLDDHDGAHPKSKTLDKSAPKPPEKTKGKRGSKKKSSTKKKKEKTNSKKDKKKSKQKAETEVTEPVKTDEATASNPLEAAVAKATEVAVAKATEVPKSVQQSVAASVPTLQGEPDLQAVASSIVAETVNIAQERLKAESNEIKENVGASSSIQETETPAPEETALKTDEESLSTDVVPISNEINDTVETVEKISQNKEDDAESETVAEDIIAQVMGKPLKTSAVVVKEFIIGDAPDTQESPEKIVEEPSEQDLPEEKAEISTTSVQNNESLLNTTDTSITKAAAEAVAVAEQAEAEINQLVASSSSLHAVEPEVEVGDKVESTRVPDIPSVAIVASESFATEAAGNIDAPYEDLSSAHTGEPASEAVAKETVEQVLVAVVETTEEKEAKRDYEDIWSKEAKPAKTTEKSDKSGSDSDNDKGNKSDQEKREMERAEKERIKKQRDEEKVKEKERVKEEKRKKAEQRAAEKAEKEKTKGDKKIKMPKRLSNFFHKKDKQPKTVGEIEVEASENEKAVSPTSPTSTASPTSSSTPTSPTADIPTQHPTESDQTKVLEVMVCPVDQAVVANQPSEASGSANESLTVDVSVEPLLPSTSATIDSGHDSAVTDSASPVSSESLESPNSQNADDEELTSPTSDGEKGVLKKISLGPRLRTAILRKKSSGASDSGHEEKKLSLTKPKIMDTTEVTPPPRKLRPRKPVEQYSPVTSGAHNVACPTDIVLPSPLEAQVDSALESSVQSEPQSPETKSPTDDSGVADLTSPEGDKSEASLNEENIAKTVVEQVINAAKSVNVSNAPVTDIFNDKLAEDAEDNKGGAKDISNSIAAENIVLDQQMHLQLTPDSKSPSEEAEEDDESKEISWPLESPTLISTATIFLRSTSAEESVNTSDKSSAATIVTSTLNEGSNHKDNEENEEKKDNEEPNIIQSIQSFVSSSVTENNGNEFNTEAATNAQTSSDEDEEQQHQYTVVCAAQTVSELAMKETGSSEGNTEHQTTDIPESSSVGKPSNAVQEQPNVRTVAEYQIGIFSEPEEEGAGLADGNLNQHDTQKEQSGVTENEESSNDQTITNEEEETEADVKDGKSYDDPEKTLTDNTTTEANEKADVTPNIENGDDDTAQTLGKESETLNGTVENVVDTSTDNKAVGESVDVISDRVNGNGDVQDGDCDLHSSNNNNESRDAGKTGPNDTIEAYLKLQYGESGVVVNGDNKDDGIDVVMGEKGVAENGTPIVSVNSSGQAPEQTTTG